MPFSHPSAAPVESSPGRPAPPQTQTRPFLELIEQAYRSEGQRVPAQVLAPPADELTIPRAHTHWCEHDDDRTVEDRPAHQKRRSLATDDAGAERTTPGFRRGLFVDPATRHPTRTVIDGGQRESSDETSGERAVDSALQRELCSLPVVVGDVIAPHGRTAAHAGGLSDGERTPIRRQCGPRMVLPILEPLDASARSGPPPLPDFAIPPGVVMPGHPTTATDPHGRVYSAEGLIFVDSELGEIDLEDIDLGFDAPEPEAFDPEAYDAEMNDFDAPEVHAPVVYDDTDPFAVVLALQADALKTEFDSQSIGHYARDHTIELSPGLLNELLLLEMRDPKLIGGRTVPDLRTFSSNALNVKKD